jgi:hypothetical protein
MNFVTTHTKQRGTIIIVLTAPVSIRNATAIDPLAAEALNAALTTGLP